jgi:hypothetical protein
MKRVGWITYVFAVGLITSACESIALRPRPDVNRAIEREAIKEEVVGTVEQVDRVKNEIRLRTTEAKVIVFKYDPNTRVYSRDREVGINALRPRDLILIWGSKTSQSERYADLIRLNDRDQSVLGR